MSCANNSSQPNFIAEDNIVALDQEGSYRCDTETMMQRNDQDLIVGGIKADGQPGNHRLSESDSGREEQSH